MYDRYWSSPERVGESSADLSTVSDRIVALCGMGNILDIGSGEGRLVEALLRQGFDAHGIDVSEEVVARSNSRIPGRFHHGSVLDLPFEDNAYFTVVSTDCLEHIAPQDIPSALSEIHRICQKNVLLQIATTQDRDGHWHLTIEGRAWWERRCLEAGFHKHPGYYRLNDYESLNRDSWQIYIFLEKIPNAVVAKHPLIALEAERDLHMDMLREVGERSDAHVIRYHWAANYLKPGDRVLDAACGLGYGGHVLRHLTAAAKVTGIDGSANSIEYAKALYGSDTTRAEYLCGMLPEALSSFEDGSFDVVVSFETLEHVEDPVGLLKEFYRVLTPGGRIIVSVPNDWSDETGEDPNPYHLHVYDWQKLKNQLGNQFILENALAQTASRCKVKAKNNTWEARGRVLQPVPWTDESPLDCEWWLMTAMKSPLDNTIPYDERVFSNVLESKHPSLQYKKYFSNPWLMHSMVNVEYRIKDLIALGDLARDVMKAYPADTNDYAAALCVSAYIFLQKTTTFNNEASTLLAEIGAFAKRQINSPMALRWKVSLLFVKAKIFEASGQLEKAQLTYRECSEIEVGDFGVHLATKTTEGAFLAGKLAYGLGNIAAAREAWTHGINLGSKLLEARLEDITINTEFPNLFNHGDGVREYAVAWDNIARCANGLHLLQRGTVIDHFVLNNSLQTEYAGVTVDLISVRKVLENRTHELECSRATVVERTNALEQASQDLISRTEDLVNTRAILKERTEALERVSHDLISRTEELVNTRATLKERTEALEQVSHDLISRTEELVNTRAALKERTDALEQVSDDLISRTEELVNARAALKERTDALEQVSGDLISRTEELVNARVTPKERTEALAQVSDDLISRTEELVKLRATLKERTEALEQVSGDLISRTEELVNTRTTSKERTEALEQVSDDLISRTEELVKLRATLKERTEALEQVSHDLISRTEELVNTRATSKERTEALAQVSHDLMSRTEELVNARTTSKERTEALEQVSQDLASRTEELVNTRTLLKERTEMLEQVSRDLAASNEELATLRETLKPNG